MAQVTMMASAIGTVESPFDDGEMVVESLHPDAIVDDIREATGWDV